MVCILLATPGMSLATVVALALLAAPPVPSAPSPHVRPEVSLRSLVEESADRSPLIRALIDRIERSDLIVYVRMRLFGELTLEGRAGMLAAAAGGQRYLIVELACGRPTATTMATLGHELFHAVEIAEEPSIVDAQTMAAFYQRRGIETAAGTGRQTFETEGAERAGRQARRELNDSTRHTWNSK